MNYSLEDGTSIASTSSDEGKDEIAIYGVTLSLFHPLRNLLVPIQFKPKEYTDYVEEYTKQLAEIVKDEDAKISQLNSQHFNNKELIEKYVDYKYKDQIPSTDGDCVRDYFINQEGSKFLNLSLLSIFLSLFLFI